VRIPRLVASAGLGVAAVLGVAAMVGAATRSPEPVVVVISIHYSHFEPSLVTVPAGRPVTFVLDNADPIDHEWIVGDEAVHQRHRTGTEPVHGARPTEVSINAGERRTTVVTFTTPGTLSYVCHLPGHEAYGMTGTLVVTGGG
jgi:uncharacterized cupredoxin-like copper-binding protein